MVQKCVCDQSALLKVLMHCAKYPSQAVNGVLLGSVDSSGDVTVTNVIPLLHSNLSLAPPTEIALATIDAYTKEPGSPKFVGYYHSDSKFQAADLPPTGRRVADKISEVQPSAVVLLVDNKKLGLYFKDEAEHPFELFTKAESKGWKRETPSQVDVQAASWKELRNHFLSMFKQQKHRALVDFDEHLDDVSKDYFNKHLDNMGKFALPGQQM